MSVKDVWGNVGSTGKEEENLKRMKKFLSEEDFWGRLIFNKGTIFEIRRPDFKIEPISLLNL